VRGGPASTAAMAAAAAPVRRRRPRHCPDREYLWFVRGQTHFNHHYLNAKIRYYQKFRDRWPDLAGWFAEPLQVRVGRLPGEPFNASSFPASHKTRPYLMFLGLRGYATFDYPWMFAVEQLRVHDQAALAGLDLGTAKLAEEAVALGYSRPAATQAMHWSVARIALHNGLTDVAGVTGEHIAEVLEEIRCFPGHPEFPSFYASAEQFYDGPAKCWITHLHQLEVVLFHRGQVATQPRKLMPSWKPPMTLPPRMQAAADKWLAARKLTDAPSTVDKLELAVRVFGDWLAGQHPGITTFAEVTRDHCLAWIGHLAETPTKTTGKPLGVMSRIQRISGLSQFFRDTAVWQYADVPGYTLIGAGDTPRYPQKVPRFIPDHELDKLMPAIDALACPFQRAALLVARWSGARRTEIQKLPIDCLDRYPDGTPRLRLSGRKTYTERVVPLHEDAAEALQKVIHLRRDAPERPFTDERTGEEIRYLFMSHGKLLSTFYLFETPIQDACKAAGLVRPGGRGGAGRGTVSAHRFRHTVGTQLAERGAKLHTIMKVLGHTSVNMALVYAQISDQEVLRDYQAVLGPGATIAGPAADELRNGTLPDASVDWLKTNFFKTELELGRCLRLPAEGPCECDLYLTCAKFVTTPEYAPRLRARRQVEQTLAADAAERGWDRELERHRCTSERIEKLLTDLGQPIDGPDDDTPEDDLDLST
jgi:integrase